MSTPEPPLVALIADVVASREHPDQPALLGALADVAEDVGGAVDAVQAPALTVGDELQAVYQGLAPALRAWLRLRVGAGTHPEVAFDLRVGLGVGEVEVTEVAPAPAGQSGSAWWHAREALDQVRDLGARSQWPRSLRTRLVSGHGRDDAGVNAVLLLADELLSGMDTTDLTILGGVLDGRTQTDTAGVLGISQPAVARRQRDKGINALHRALQELTGELDGGQA